MTTTKEILRVKQAARQAEREFNDTLGESLARGACHAVRRICNTVKRRLAAVEA